MRMTFWANRIFQRFRSKNRFTGLKFRLVLENSRLCMKILQNVLFRPCGGCFGQISFFNVPNPKIAQGTEINANTWKHVLTKSDFLAPKFSKSWNWPQIFAKTGKQCAFHENCTKRSYQVMGSTFWPNRILERQSFQNRHADLKFSRKRENSAPSMKIVQEALFRSCAARFGEIAFLSGKVFKIVKLAWNSLQNRKTVRFRRKLYKTRFSGHAQHVLAKSDFWAPKFSKSWNWPQIFAKTGKQCAFHENCTKRSFQVMRSTFWPNLIFKRQSSQNRETGRKFSSKRIKQCAFHESCITRSFQVMRSKFWPNRILERQSSQNRHAGLKFSRKRENSAPSMKIVQNALFRSCAARFGQIAF